MTKSVARNGHAKRWDADFDVEAACLKVDHELLKRARHKYSEVIDTKPKGEHEGSRDKGTGKSGKRDWNSGGNWQYVPQKWEDKQKYKKQRR